MKVRLLQALRGLWNALRNISGDDAYERYLEHLKRHHPDAMPLSPRGFYLSEQQRRWDGGPNRCC
jgi:uncharacterized short protein YbdD (DUF466 family)